MKMLIMALGLLCSMTTFAYDYDIAECGNTDGSGRNINLVIVNNEVVQVRFLTGSETVSRVLAPARVPTQQDGNFTFYTIPGIYGFMVVQNEVLKDLWGQVRLENEIYYCD